MRDDNGQIDEAENADFRYQFAPLSPRYHFRAASEYSALIFP